MVSLLLGVSFGFGWFRLSLCVLVGFVVLSVFVVIFGVGFCGLMCFGFSRVLLDLVLCWISVFSLVLCDFLGVFC